MAEPQSAPRLHVVADDQKSSRVNSTVPEAMFISALLASGSYTPDTFGVKDHQFLAQRQVHEFCRAYQQRSSEAPPVHLVRERYPSFTFTPDVHPAWAAAELHHVWKARVLHKALAEAAICISDDKIDDAFTGLKTALGAIHPLVGRGSEASDLTYLNDTVEVKRCPIGLPGSGIGGSHNHLQALTGGIAPGDLWYVGARMGIGKSWRLLEMAVAAAESGWPVLFYSLEMPQKQVKDRIHRIALRNAYHGHWGDIGLEERRQLVGQWAEQTAPITIYDPSAGSCDATIVATAGETGALVVIDYVGLMRTTNGQMSMEDWRAAAIISNQLKQAAIEHNVPVISAAQINRSGDSAAEPSTVHLAQTDALGQDADLVVTLKKMSARVLLNYVPKNRHGASGGRWFTRFEPEYGRFSDLTPDAAKDLKAEDDEFDASKTE